MSSRADLWARLVEHVQSSPATLSVDDRQWIFAASSCDDASLAPPDLGSFVETVARHAELVTDDQVAGLTSAGRSEDELYECVVVAAVGAADRRLHAALRALGESS